MMNTKHEKPSTEKKHKKRRQKNRSKT